MKRRLHTPVQLFVFGSLACLLLVGLYLALSLVGARHNTEAAANQQSQPIHCSYPDASYCMIEHRLSGFVVSSDASDILENETPTPVVCGGGSPILYCNGIAKGLTIDLFRIVQNNDLLQVPRNTYMSLALSYFSQYGPFHFVESDSSGTAVLMRFMSKGKTTYYYTLQLQKDNGTWHIETTVLGSV